VMSTPDTLDLDTLFASILDLPDAREDHCAHLVSVDGALEMVRAFVTYHRSFGYSYNDDEWDHLRSDLSGSIAVLQGFLARLPERAPTLEGA